jgi:hypothetical protein
LKEELLGEAFEVMSLYDEDDYPDLAHIYANPPTLVSLNRSVSYFKLAMAYNNNDRAYQYLLSIDRLLDLRRKTVDDLVS